MGFGKFPGLRCLPCAWHAGRCFVKNITKREQKPFQKYVEMFLDGIKAVEIKSSSHRPPLRSPLSSLVLGRKLQAEVLKAKVKKLLSPKKVQHSIGSIKHSAQTSDFFLSDRQLHAEVEDLEAQLKEREDNERNKYHNEVSGKLLQNCNWKCLISKFFFVFLTSSTAGFLVFVGFVIHLHPERSGFVSFVLVCVLYFYLNNQTGGWLKRFILKWIRKIGNCLTPRRNRRRIIRRVLTFVCSTGIFVFLVIDIWDDWKKWPSLGGLVLFVILSVLFSTHPTKINWTPVIWGIILQFVLALIILRWETGFSACQLLGNQVTTMLEYTNVGSEFVFGEHYTLHPFAFQVMPTVIYTCAIIAMLYYIGAMQATIKGIAIVLQFVLDTTPIESFGVASHIFFGMAETVVALKPFMVKLTKSELHAIISSGFATVAGTLIAAYVECGIPAEHVISASFMSAPAAMAIAKISIPETELSRIKTQKDIHIPSGQESNMLEALTVGAVSAIQLIGFILANLIAFISILDFLDAVVSYLGALVNHPEVNFQLFFSYLFMPLVAVMGVPWSDCQIVGGLLGKKIIANELLSFADLGSMLKSGSIQDRSGVLATYMLCGFSGITSLGVYMGILVLAAPERKSDFAQIVFRSLVNGNIACFMTACIAGLLYQDHPLPDVAGSVFNQSLYNTTAGLINATTVRLF